VPAPLQDHLRPALFMDGPSKELKRVQSGPMWTDKELLLYR